ncbi:4-alpha-glucanotransferase [Thermosulfurimonas dismutans]|uniref:4-alpha-glucanotransferase n=1 Tax=Thermosulfurimonas dismutans TaxID=999894 RepID=A0A179D299_9BACT|nr:4-alpha-glucanotransferase [Thermosulfurimonas dismutans]OAQ20113.1 4-alpha-glucanotransferase (amylomaltase) [Thermosulfurimonas dismutans]
MKIRRAGILLPISALPSPYGVGDFGPEAFRFVDFLKAAGQSLWQILPLNPTRPRYGNSPYLSFSLFAGNPLLISPEKLYEEGLLPKEDLAPPNFPEDRVNYPRVMAYKRVLLRKAWERFKPDHEFEAFYERERDWLEDYALYTVLEEESGRPWPEWEESVRHRDPEILAGLKKAYRERIEEVKFEQYLFFKQWFVLKSYANERGIFIVGDLPFYPGYESVEVWSNPKVFKLDENLRPAVVAGVPPDYFSRTGQLWGNPVYNWEVLEAQGFSWWLKRLAHNLKLFDILRLDHFRGFVAYWEVPAGEKTAVNGHWVEAPAQKFFEAVFRRLLNPSLLAEDLGYITSDVREIRKLFGIPGMKVLVFAFFEEDSPYLPHNHEKEAFVYTGTHDTNTVKGWFERELNPEARRRLDTYVGKSLTAEIVSKEMVRLAYASPAKAAIIPIQDLLGLGEEARINTPSRREGNWEWRLRAEALSPELSSELYELACVFGRSP